jgi:uncharacterized protein YtpQ (UPF0354 family)
VVVPLVRADRNHELDRAADPAVDRADWVLPPDDPSTPVIDFLVGSLVVLYAFDLDDQFRMVTHHDLDALGVDQAALVTAASDNLIDRMGELQILERPDGCGMLRLDGNLESSALLVPQLWRDIAGILSDEVIVAVPARDIVLFCGFGNERNREALSAARDRALAVGDHIMTKDLLRFHDDAWQIEPQ